MILRIAIGSAVTSKVGGGQLSETTDGKYILIGVYDCNIAAVSFVNAVHCNTYTAKVMVLFFARVFN